MGEREREREKEEREKREREREKKRERDSLILLNKDKLLSRGEEGGGVVEDWEDRI